MGAVTILLAALLLCLTAYFEQWGQHLITSSSVDSSAPAPNTEDPSYFEDKDIPRVFEEYATLHNSATASPMNAKYVVFEMPGNTTLAHSLFGLVRRMVDTTIPSSAAAANCPRVVVYLLFWSDYTTYNTPHTHTPPAAAPDCGENSRCSYDSPVTNAPFT